MEALPPQPSRETCASQREVVACCLLVTLFALAFTLLWWNRYLGVTNDGWHFFHAQQILDGRVPYRDFYLFIPPLHPLRVAAEIALFGDYLIVPQLFGLLERLLLFNVLCVWLCRFFAARYVALGVMTGAAFYLADASESLSSLHHEAIFWATLAAFCLSSALASVKRKPAWCAAAGVLAGLAFLGKQTSGIGIAVAIALFLLLAAKRDGWQTTRKALTSYAAGLALPIAALFIWLASQHAFAAYIEQIFLRGPSSKGALSETLLRPLTMLIEDLYLRRFALLALLLLAALALLLYRKQRQAATKTDDATTLSATVLQVASRPEKRGGGWRDISGGVLCVITIVGGAALVLLTGVLLSQTGEPGDSFLMQAAVYVPLFIAELGMLALCAVYARGWWRGTLAGEDWQQFAFALTTLAVLATLALSWVAFISMAIPALPFLIALALGRLRRLPQDWLTRAARLALTAGCAVVTLVAVWGKLSAPYGWAAWQEPAVHRATEVSALPELAGLKISPATKAQVERITHLIQQHATADEAVFVYPHLPIFYTLAHRRPATFAAVHFFDVNPDYVARQDARRILEAPPAVIVDFEFSEAQIVDNEQLFRGGKPSGQRELMAAIGELTASQYELLASYEAPARRNPIRVWARRRPPAPQLSLATTPDR